MPIAGTNRKRLFRAALALSGLTAERWSYKRGINAGQLSRALSGTLENVEIEAKVDAFIKEHRDTYTALAS